VNPSTIRQDERSQQGATITPRENKSPLTLLNQLAFEKKKAQHPDIRPELLAKPIYKDKTANDLTKSIIAWIQLNGGQAERISVTGRAIDHRHTYTDVLGHRRQIGSLQWLTASMKKGSADISATIQGRSVKCEVKVQRDKQRPEQKEYQRQVEAAGGIYFIATSFEQFYNWYESIFNTIK
jgi:hypothetical protein